MTSRLVTGDVRERPILFSGEMVRALLSERSPKTQTRRACKPVRGFDHMNNLKHGMPYAADPWAAWWHGPDTDRVGCLQDCPYGKPGDRLWVRESWQYYDWNGEGEPCIRYSADNATAWPEPGVDEWADRLLDIWAALSLPENYNIDNRASDRTWRPSIHMPRWASRITLEITDVRVERLQAISEADAKAEGADAVIVGGIRGASYREGYAQLWESIYGPGSWEANTYVWAISFNRIKEPQ